jgi:hypothetical protein
MLGTLRVHKHFRVWEMAREKHARRAGVVQVDVRDHETRDALRIVTSGADSGEKSGSGARGARFHQGGIRGAIRAAIGKQVRRDAVRESQEPMIKPNVARAHARLESSRSSRT